MDVIVRFIRNLFLCTIAVSLIVLFLAMVGGGLDTEEFKLKFWVPAIVVFTAFILTVEDYAN